MCADLSAMLSLVVDAGKSGTAVHGHSQLHTTVWDMQDRGERRKGSLGTCKSNWPCQLFRVSLAVCKSAAASVLLGQCCSTSLTLMCAWLCDDACGSELYTARFQSNGLRCVSQDTYSIHMNAFQSLISFMTSFHRYTSSTYSYIVQVQIYQASSLCLHICEQIQAYILH